MAKMLEGEKGQHGPVMKKGDLYLGTGPQDRDGEPSPSSSQKT